jgi:hypothetical protein
MGVDCEIVLPHSARVDDACEVLATLAGAPGFMRPLGKRDDGVSAFWTEAVIEVDPFGQHPRRIHEAALLDVVIKCPPGADWQFITGQPMISPYWFWNHHVGRSVGKGLRHEHDGRGFVGRSTAFWIAAARGLINFFGGWADFNDCDDRDVNYQRPEAPDLLAHDGEPWQLFQDRKGAVKPLTMADLAWAEKYAAYPNAGALR